MFLKLLVAQLKMLVRNRGALVAVMIMPIFFAGLLGAASRIGEGDTKLAVINEGGESGALFIKALRSTKAFEVTELDSRAKLESSFEERKLDGALVIPKIDNKAEVLFIFDERNAALFGRTQERVSSFVERYNLELSGGSEILTLGRPVPLRTRDLRSQFQYQLPGILMFSVIFSALSFGGSQAVKYRESGVFKRLMVTPASPRSFLLSEAVTKAIVALGQTTLVLAVGLVIERTVPPVTTLWLFPLAVMGVMVFINIGFIAAGLSGNPDAVAGVTNLLGIALVLVSGGALQTVFPPEVKQAVAFLPIQPMLNSMLGVITSKASPIEAAPVETAVLATWVAGTFLLALLVFRFRAPSKR
jgi:ABC-type multidrug transport system permease subunit